MPRISIYVPEEMKSRMDAAGERANWSATAQRAFEFELSYIETVTEIGSMIDVIERLRASKAKFVGDQTTRGRLAGIEWAKRKAEYPELRRVADTLDPENQWWHHQSGPEAAEHVVQIVMAEDRPNDRDVAEFWGIERRDIPTMSYEYVVSFVAGAKEVWEEVRNQI